MCVCVCDPGECGACAAPVIFASASPRGLGNVSVCVSGASLECEGRALPDTDYMSSCARVLCGSSCGCAYF